MIQTLGLRTIQYALFSRSGFSEALAARARDEGVFLVGPDRLVQPPTAPQ